MDLVRTTLRLRADLKRAADKLAFDRQITLQELMNRALDAELKRDSKAKVKKIKFIGHHLGVPLDSLTREDYYAED